MTDPLLQTRRTASKQPIELQIGPLQVPADISSRPVRFYMWATDDTKTRLIDAGVASATDISSAAMLETQTLWKLSYTPEEGEDVVTGIHMAEFEVDYGSGQLRQYPSGDRFIEIFIRPHKGVPVTP